MEILEVVSLMVAIFFALTGVSLWLAGLINRDSSWVWSNILAALLLTASFLCIQYGVIG